VAGSCKSGKEYSSSKKCNEFFTVLETITFSRRNMLQGFTEPAKEKSAQRSRYRGYAMGSVEFKSCQRQKLFLPSKISGLALGPHSLQFSRYRGSFLRLRRPGRGMMLTPHLHLAPRLRMSGITPPLTIRHHVVDRHSFTFALFMHNT
jgi:hypothetical protein